MTETEIKQLLEQPYNRQNWKNFLQTQFSKIQLNAKDVEVNLENNNLSDKCLNLGFYEIDEYSKIPIFEVQLKNSVNITRNRVALRNLLKNIYRQMSAVMVVFVQGDKWRFSYVSTGIAVNKETGEIEHQQTAPKRYTYLFGTGEKALTATQRFCELIKREKLKYSLEKKDFEDKWTTGQKKDIIEIYFPENLENPSKLKAKSEHIQLETTIERQIMRLITRLLFIWFIKQKNFVPDYLFDRQKIEKILKNFDPNSKTNGNYYNAILQNLFFATLNQEIEKRNFTDKNAKKRQEKNLFRYSDMFDIPKEEVLKLFEKIPFLNGGLFECLDKEVNRSENKDNPKYHIDGFSNNDTIVKGKYTQRAFVPNAVFFDQENGLFQILQRYNFTVEENTADDIQVALDPELLGNVFENLLGYYNQETRENARKSSGSFYTPRQIVDYMCNQSLITYLKNQFPNQNQQFFEKLVYQDELPEQLKDLTNYNVFELRKKIANSLQELKIIDPACGSGAFTVGILNRIVNVLSKLKTENQDNMFLVKLHLIQKCIYGVDIQPTAIQISKLRFFISLILEQNQLDQNAKNYGITPLPNLETKFVTADTLLSFQSKVNLNKVNLNKAKNKNEKQEEQAEINIGYEELQELQNKLSEIREQHFSPISQDQKKELREQDQKLRNQMFATLVENSYKVDLSKIETYKKKLEELTEKRKKYEGWVNWSKDESIQTKIEGFSEPDKGKQKFLKKDLNEEERNKIDQQIKKLKAEIEKAEQIRQLPEIVNLEKVAKWSPYEQNDPPADFFSTYWMFSLEKEDAFDIVIGNPPYIQLQKNGGMLGKKYQAYNYKTFSSMGDIYSLFYERGCQLLKKGGLLCFITSNKWMRANYGQNTRQFFLDNTKPLLLVDFGGQKIFENATVDTNILLLKNTKPNLNEKATTSTTYAITINEKVEDLFEHVNEHANPTYFDSADGWTLLSPIQKQIKQKVESKGTPLKEWNISINYGIKTGYNEAFIIDKQKRDELIAADPKNAEIIKPILRGKDIKRYSYEFKELYLINTHNGVKEKINGKIIVKIPRIDINDYPSIKAHLEQKEHWQKVKKRSDQGDTPYNLRNCAYIEEFEKEKVVYPNMVSVFAFIYDTNNFLTNQKCFILTGHNLKFLTAFCNSILFEYCFRDNFPALGKDGRELSKTFFEKIPILRVSEEVNLEFGLLVDEIQRLKKVGAPSEHLEKEIDAKIYAMYGLSKEEILAIERN